MHPAATRRTAQALAPEAGQQRRHLPAGPAGVAVLLPPRRPRAGGTGDPRGRAERARLAPGLERLQRQLAAELGLPFAFASHFAPDYLYAALDLYRRISALGALAKPYAMVGVNVFAADTDAEARRLFTSLQQQFLNLVRGTPRQLPPPVDTMDGAGTRPSGRTSSA